MTRLFVPCISLCGCPYDITASWQKNIPIVCKSLPTHSKITLTITRESQFGCSKHGTRLKISRFHGARLIFLRHG